jgi:hypothetical protein
MLPLVLVLGALVAVGAARLGVAVIGEHRAQVAADAAALAGVGGGERAATELAAANGARLVSFERDGADVVVVVSRGDSTATARASDGP